jgi:hypothetical protein
VFESKKARMAGGQRRCGNKDFSRMKMIRE